MEDQNETDPGENSAEPAENTPRPHSRIPLMIFLAVVILLLGVSGVLLLARQQENQTQRHRAGDYLQQFTLDPSAQGACHKFFHHLPATVGAYHLRTLNDNSATQIYESTEHKAWPVRVKCGINAPQELTAGSELRNVNQVDWLTLPSRTDYTRNKTLGLVWIVVDRPIFIALWVPRGTPTGVLQDTATYVKTALPKVSHTH